MSRLRARGFEGADPETAALVLFSRWLLFLTWPIRFGWLLVMLAGAALVGASIALFVSWPTMPEIVARIAMAMLVGAWSCLAILLAMVRRQLRGCAPQWERLTTFGKSARLLLTALGTALLVAPFVAIGWLVLR
jgi:NAD/NADP transhydrogenase beta subunit